MSDRLRVELGRVVGAHALRGELRVRFFADAPETLVDAEHVFLGESRGDPGATRYAVAGVGSGRPGEVRLALDGVSDRTAAEALRGRLVLVDADALEPLGEDDFYWHELIGCEVATEDGRTIGTVRELWDTGRHDVLVVDAEAGGQVLVPTAREIMKRVDRAAGRIVIEAIPGLIVEPEEPEDRS